MGANPEAGLVEGGIGIFYGTTRRRRKWVTGTVFKNDAPGKMTTYSVFNQNGGQWRLRRRVWLRTAKGIFIGAGFWRGASYGRCDILKIKILF